MKLPVGFTLALLVCGVAMAHADEEALNADRPDFTNGPQVLSPGQVQVEGGYTYSRSGTAKQQDLGELLVRVPLSRKVEVRVGVPSYAWQSNGGRSSGFGDASLGAKVELAPGGGKKPALGLLVGASLPTGAQAIGSGSWQPQAVFLASWGLCPTTDVSVNLGGARSVDAGTRFNQIFGSVSVGHSLGGKWGTYAEVYGFNKASAAGSSAKYADSGLTYLVNNDLQLDARFGIGVNNHAGGPDFFTGFGVARRF